MLDRIDETLYFGLPAVDARWCLIHLYYDGYVTRVARSRSRLAAVLRSVGRGSVALDVASNVTDTLLEEVAVRTEGFSGREIEKLFVAVQSVAYGRGGQLDAATLRAVVATKREEHGRKQLMNETDVNIRSASVDRATHSPQADSTGRSPGRRR